MNSSNGTDDSEIDPRVLRSRSVVLAAATTLLKENGLHGFTMERITERSGVAKTTIYRLWGGKAPLIIDALSALLPPAEAVDDTGALVDRAATVLHRSAQTLQSPEHRRVLPLLLDAAWRDADMAGPRNEFMNRQLGPMRDLLAKTGASASTVAQQVERLYGPLIFRIIVTEEIVGYEWCRDVAESVLLG